VNGKIIKTTLSIFILTVFLSAAMIVGCGGGSGGSSSGSATSTPTPTPTATSTVDYTSSDFMPPSGAATGDDTPEGIGPWNCRIMIAQSNDSLTFTRKNKILSDQADVPCAMVDSAGRIFVYYVAWSPSSVRNKSVAAVSIDDGKTWAYKKVSISGMSGEWADAVDPTGMLLENGNIRLYFTSQSPNASKAGPYCAISSDGLNFTLESESSIVGDNDHELLDPCVVLFGSEWHLYNGPFIEQKGGNSHFTSGNGTTFTQAAYIDPGDMLMSNAVKISSSTYRLYGFPYQSGVAAYIESATSDDGENWTKDSGRRLELDESSGLESMFVKDPGICKNSKGLYLMFYVTKIPD